ncbi:heme-binding protein [Peribacillus saganii]|uniref:Heme-binding protein n=1 Tax=Peribacillus saganii TaxID=2303992 RepID=A0A372LG88_9BACI|nr:heme-binding protein [Peribacillus saganii]RFU64565.1 heme-binding protein [Peribacillus saganii]
MKFITLEVARNLISGGEQKAKEIGISAVIAIVDEGGHLVACHRMDDAPIASIDHAQDKAWTAVAMKRPTLELTSLAAPNGQLFGINTKNNGRITTFGGGIPIIMDEKIVGAVGVCCGTIEHDLEVAAAVVEAFIPEENGDNNSNEVEEVQVRKPPQDYLQEFYEQHLRPT